MRENNELASQTSPVGHGDPCPMPPESDCEYEEASVKTVTAEKSGGWSIQRSDGWSFYVPAGSPEPKPGMTARFYGRGLGYPVRGLTLDGKCAFYRTSEDYERHDKEQRYGKDCADLLARWDRGEGVWSIELGGLGPGYEQAIQLAGFEFLRAMIAVAPDASKWADSDDAWKADRKAVEAVAGPVIEPLGLSGAQWGAGLNMAAVFYRNGPVAAMEMAADNRRLQVSRNFPSLPSRSQGASDGPQGQDGQHKTNPLSSRLPEQGR